MERLGVMQAWGGGGASRAVRRKRGGARTVALALAIVAAAAATPGTKLSAADAPAVPTVPAQPKPEAATAAAAPFSVVALRGGRELEFSGAIVPGAAEALERVLDGAARGAKLLHLSGPGGFQSEAFRMSAVVRRHRLSTYVRTECDSACATVFLAGAPRVLRSGAALGFHRGRDAAAPRDDRGEQMPPEVREVFGRLGVAAWFMDRIDATPPNQIWQPTADELVRGGVVHMLEPGRIFSPGRPARPATPEDARRSMLRQNPLASLLSVRDPATFGRAVAEFVPMLDDGASARDGFIHGVRAALPLVLAAASAAPDEHATAAARALGTFAGALPAEPRGEAACAALAVGGDAAVATIAPDDFTSVTERFRLYDALRAAAEASAATPQQHEPPAAALAEEVRSGYAARLPAAARAAAVHILGGAAPPVSEDAPREARRHCEALAALRDGSKFPDGARTALIARLALSELLRERPFARTAP